MPRTLRADGKSSWEAGPGTWKVLSETTALSSFRYGISSFRCVPRRTRAGGMAVPSLRAGRAGTGAGSTLLVWKVRILGVPHPREPGPSNTKVCNKVQAQFSQPAILQAGHVSTFCIIVMKLVSFFGGGQRGREGISKLVSAGPHTGVHGTDLTWSCFAGSKTPRRCELLVCIWGGMPVVEDPRAVFAKFHRK